MVPLTYLKRLTIGHIDLNGIEEVGSVMDLTIDDVEGFKNSIKFYSI